MNLTTTLVINDVHGPFHDPRALDLVTFFAQDVGVDRIILNGDILDFYNINSHGAKHPDVQQCLEDEIEWGQDFIRNLRKMFPTQEIIFNAGNHCYRLDRFIMEKCPAFWNIVSIEKQLELEYYNIQYNEYNSSIRLENTELMLCHSPPSYSKNGAMTSLERKIDVSYMYGCSHRLDFACKTGSSGKIYAAWYNGWLGSTTLTKEHQRVFSYAKGHENWQRGFSLVDVYGGREHQVRQYIIDDNYRIFHNGEVYQG